MFIELRLPVEPFLRNLRNRLKQIALPLTTPLPLASAHPPITLPGCDGSPVWLDRIKVWDGTIVEDGDGSSLKLRQPIDIFVVCETTLRANDVAPSPPCWGRTVAAVFTLSVFIIDNVPQMCLSFDGLEPGNDVDKKVLDFLGSMIAGLPELAAVCESLDLALLDQMFAGNPPAVQALSLVATANRIALRIDFDLNDFGLPATVRQVLQARQTLLRNDFLAGQFKEDDPAKDWTLLVDASLMTLSARRQILAGLADQADTFRLETSPSTEFLADSQALPWIRAQFSGEVIDACLCAWGELDLDVDIETTLHFSLPEPDVLEARMEVDFDLSDLEVACCAITTGFLWLAVGQVWIKSGDLSGGEMAGLTVGQVAFGPALIAVGFMAMAHDKGAGKFQPGPDWTKISTEQDEPPLVYRRRFGAALGDVGFGPMHTTGLVAVNKTLTKGLILSGTIQPAAEVGDPKLHASRPDEFDAGFDDTCGDNPKLVAEFSVSLLAHAPGVPTEPFLPLRYFVVKLVDGTDPLKQYSPFMQRVGDRVNFSIPFDAIKPGYRSAPYRPELLVATSGGVRIIRLPAVPLWTPAQIADAERINALMRTLHCRDWRLSQAFWKGSRYNPRWSVDPGPDDMEVQWWEVAVEGLAVGEAVRFDGLDGQHLITARTNASGAAVMRGMVTGPMATRGLSLLRLKPGQTTVPPVVVEAADIVPRLLLNAGNLAVERRRWEAAAKGRLLLRPVLDPKQRITLRQRALPVVARLNLPQSLRALLPDTLDGQARLIVAMAHSAQTWQLDTGVPPRLVNSVALRGAERLLRWRGQVCLFAPGHLVPLDDPARGITGPAGAGAWLDADSSGNELFLLTERGVWLRDGRGGEPQALTISATGCTRLAVHNDTLALVNGETLQVYARQGARVGALIGQIALPGVGRVMTLQAGAGPGDLYEVRAADDSSWGVSVTGQRLWLAWQSPSGGRIDQLARLGRLLASGRHGGSEVLVAELGAARLLRRS